MYIIGTAGHVDHGKSNLVKALTGIDPDRLQEEKDRELTIDLGYAWFDLPDHKNVSVIDVPGHEKFINNMLAGVGSIDMALLVIAADESVMPQTREHLQILELLKIKVGAIAITKIDLVEKGMIDLVKEDVIEMIRDTFLENALIVPVSSKTGDGMNDLKVVINKNLSNIRDPRDIDQARLSIDRAFSMDGFGTIVTGNLRDGKLFIGQQVEIVNSGKRSRIRGLQTHNTKATKAIPGTRVAVNLSGIPIDEVARGDVLAPIGVLSPTNAFDIHLKVLKNIPNNLRHNMFVNVHLGSAQQIGKLRLLDCDTAKPGDEVWAQIKLNRKLIAIKNDYCIIRSNQATLGGGVVVEPHAKRYKIKHAETIAALNLKLAGSTEDLIVLSTDKTNPVQIQSIVKETHLSDTEIQNSLVGMIKSKQIIRLVFNQSFYYQTFAKWKERVEEIENELSNYHTNFPGKVGVTKNELNKNLNLSPKTTDIVLNNIKKSKLIIIENGYIRLSSHKPKLSMLDEIEANLFLSMLKERKYSPLTDSVPHTYITENLISRGKIIKINEQIFYDTSTYEVMLSKFVDFLKKHEQINISEIKDLFNVSRKYALGFAEHLDQKQISKRMGDIRILKTLKREPQ